MSDLIFAIDAPKAVVDEFRTGFHAQMALAKIRQERINEGTRRVMTKTLPGTGQLVASIDPDVYFAMRHRFGSECWSDKSFLKDCVKKGLIEKPQVAKKASIIRP